MSRVKATRREVEYIGERLRRLAGSEIEPDVTRAILKLKDLGLREVDKIAAAAVKGGADQDAVDRLVVHALVCKLLLIQRAFDESSRYDRIVEKNQKRGRMTLAQKHTDRNELMAAQYRERAREIGCLNARRELSEKWELSLRHVSNILRSEGVEINTRKSK